MRDFALAALLVLLTACSDGPADDCVEELDLACEPLYAPTFDNVYARTLHETCAQPGTSCHASTGNQGGLSFDDPDTAYAQLLDASKTRIVPGDAACSLLVERIEATDDSLLMPPGSPLSGPERCAIEQWIENGAKR